MFYYKRILVKAVSQNLRVLSDGVNIPFPKDMPFRCCYTNIKNSFLQTTVSFWLNSHRKCILSSNIWKWSILEKVLQINSYFGQKSKTICLQINDLECFDNYFCQTSHTVLLRLTNCSVFNKSLWRILVEWIKSQENVFFQLLWIGKLMNTFQPDKVSRKRIFFNCYETVN